MRLKTVGENPIYEILLESWIILTATKHVIKNYFADFSLH